MGYSNKVVLLNLIWRYAERFLAQLITFGVSLVLSRILLPQEYGVVALISIIIAILEVFTTRGFNQALIQEKEISDVDYSSVFWMNLIINSSLYVIVFFFAPIISRFYSNNDLILMLRVLGLRLFISAFNTIQQAYVQRNMLFKKFFYSTLGGTLVSGVVGIVLALKGLGSWALIIQSMTNSIVDTFVLFITIDWKPKFQFSFSFIKRKFGYGMKMFTMGLLDSIYDNVRSLIIGKRYSSSELAFYNKGQSLPNMIVSNIQVAGSNVFFSALSREKDIENVKIKMRQYLSTMFFIIAPLMCGLACIAKDAIYILFSDKWNDATPFLIIYCFSYLSWVPQIPILQAMNALNKTTQTLILSIIHRTLGIIILIVLLNRGPLYIAFGALFADIFITILVYIFGAKVLKYNVLEIFNDIYKTIISTLIMSALVYLVGKIIDNIIIRFIVEILVGMIVYVVSSFLLNNQSIVFIKDNIRGRK